ncbi:MAG: type II secretion system F family protein [Pirellulales bacterium]
MTPLLITIMAFVCVAALVGAVAVTFRESAESKFDDRLSSLLGASSAKEKKPKPSLLAQPIEDRTGIGERLVQRVARLRLLFEQADTRMTPRTFLLVSGALAAVAFAAVALTGVAVALAPVAAAAAGSLPLIWLIVRRNRRIQKFAVQLPDALELVARALRAGHSLAAGFNLVQDEMPAPIGREFGRVFEEQNLGIPLEDALQGMTDRVPNLDLRFFATAVILQRQTGGDLAEILDKIGSLIRERFKIWGQVQALTGEGRLSGVVLLALPPLLFLAVYRLNRDYVMMLFTDEMGKKMLLGAVVMQLLGALVIRKIVNIKV